MHAYYSSPTGNCQVSARYASNLTIRGFKKAHIAEDKPLCLFVGKKSGNPEKFSKNSEIAPKIVNQTIIPFKNRDGDNMALVLVKTRY
jgi:hypothetical protein